MLAYVFWHWKRAGVDDDEYESRQRAFHAALAAAPPRGFSRSHSFAIVGAPWANEGGPAWEDWYLVGDATALDALNEGAISATRTAPHDAAASVAAAGTAGIYRLRLGAPTSPRSVSWFAKPPGMRYDELNTRLTPCIIATSDAALWMRFMVLGPAPEFCLQSREPLAIPPPFTGCSIALRAIWPDRAAATARITASTAERR